MLRRTLMAAAVVCAVAVAPAHAQVSLTAVPGSTPYAGPAPTFDFESPSPYVSGGLVTNTPVSGVSAQPFGSTGYFWTVGPTDGSPGILDLSSFASILSISFIWGSVDSYNTLEVLGRGVGEVLATFTGAHASVNPNGDQVLPANNPLATLTFTGLATQTNIGGLRLSSTSNAFEVDNISIVAPVVTPQSPVPEPATWAMMLLGFGLVGFGLRKRAASQGHSRLRVAYS